MQYAHNNVFKKNWFDKGSSDNFFLNADYEILSAANRQVQWKRENWLHLGFDDKNEWKNKQVISKFESTYCDKWKCVMFIGS